MRVAAALVLALLGGSSCALLYDFGDGGGGAATTSTKPSTASTAASMVTNATATATTTETGASTSTATSGSTPGITADKCWIVGGPGTDVPGKPALALSGDRLFYTGVYDLEPTYFGQELPMVMLGGRGIVLALLDPEALTLPEPKAAQAGISASDRPFVSARNESVLFGGAFTKGDLNFDNVQDSATMIDGFLLQYGANTQAWPVPDQSFFGNELFGGMGVQGLSMASLGSDSSVVAIGAAGQLGAAPQSCDADTGTALQNGFARLVDIATVDCGAQTFLSDVRGSFMFDVVHSGVNDTVFIAAQHAADAAPGSGTVRVYDRHLVPSSGEVVFASPEGRVRLAADGATGGAFYCATTYACAASGDCANYESNVPVTTRVGSIDDQGFRTDQLETVGGQAGWIECGAIAYHGGDVIIGGRFHGEVKLQLKDTDAITTLTPTKSGESSDAFLVRYTPGTTRIASLVVGGPGEEDITTIIAGRSAEPVPEIFVAGATTGLLSSMTCDEKGDGGSDVFLLRAQLDETLSARR